MDDVIRGQDDYLFLSNDSNRVTDQLRGILTLSDRECHAIAFCHKSRLRFMEEELKGTYLHIVVPNKEVVLSYLLPSSLRLQEHGLTPISAYLESEASRGAPTFYRPNLLRQVHLTEPAFSRTDTHWTHAGAIAYLIFALRSGGLEDAAAALTAMPRDSIDATQAGDLGIKIDLPPEKLVIVAPSGKLINPIFTNEIRNEGCFRFYKNSEAPIAMRVVLMHDSTAMWLFKFFSNLFTEIVMIHYPDLDPVFISNYRPNLIIFMQIERFFIRPPRNDVSWPDVVGKEEERKSAVRSAVEVLADPTKLLLYAKTEK